MSSIEYKFSDLYFESTPKTFHTSPATVKEHDHFSKKDWTTENIYCLKSFSTGTYLAYDLHRRPHYQFYPSKREEIKQKAAQEGISDFKYFTGETVIKPGNIFHFGSKSKHFQKHASPIINEVIDLDAITDMLMEVEKLQKEGSSKVPKDRGTGNITGSVGYASQNQKFNGVVTAPVCSKDISEFDAKHLEFMTSFYNEVYGKYIMNTPQKVDMNRIMEWGNKLPMNQIMDLVYIVNRHHRRHQANQSYQIV